MSDIKAFTSAFSEISFKHVLREVNFTADALVKSGHELMISMRVEVRRSLPMNVLPAFNFHFFYVMFPCSCIYVSYQREKRKKKKKR